MADDSGMLAALPALGETRCYWAIMDSGMNFRYVDPVLQGHLSEQASSIIGRNLVDFIHPEEKAAARDDFSKFKTSTTIFGSVTRCRYSRISNARRILGAEDLVAPGGFENKVLDEQWANARIVASVVAENTVLTFFHVTRDVDPVADNDDINISHWSNWCGPRVDDFGKHYFTAAQVFMLGEALKFCQNTSDELSDKANQSSEIPSSISPAYVFQILGTKSDAIHISWPPPIPTGEKEDLTMHGPAPEGQNERYSVSEYATLARGVISKPREKRNTGDAQTNCTKRFQSKHPITIAGVATTIESVVISYQDITFVCFQSEGGNNKAGFDQGSKAGKRKQEETSDNGMMAALKKIRSGKSGSKVAADSQSQSPANSDFDMNNWAQKFAQNPHPASPTVASASAILGSFSSQSPQSGGADQNNQSLQAQQNASFQNMASPQHQSSSLNQSWTNLDQNDSGEQNLSTSYYNNTAYPSMYSNMFSAGDGRTASSAAFMSGSTNIPPMPSPTGGMMPTGNNNTNTSTNGGNTPLQNLALASSSSYYSEYNAQQAYDMAEAAKIQSLQYAPGPSGNLAQPDPSQSAGPGGERSPLVYTTRSVRKIDKNRICTSCGTTNSPEWRKGPSGIKTLCNACGLRYSRAQARKAKKAQKEADRINGITTPNGSTSTQSQGQGQSLPVFQPHDLNQNSAPANFTMPPPLQIPPGPSSAPSGSHSPYMSMGDYGNPHSAPLPPLPIENSRGDSNNNKSSGAEGDTNNNNSQNNKDVDNGNDANGNGQPTHPGSTAPNYGGYGSFVNYTPYGEWSPASNQSFASQQNQPQNTSQGQGSQGGS